MEKTKAIASYKDYQARLVHTTEVTTLPLNNSLVLLTECGMHLHIPDGRGHQPWPCCQVTAWHGCIHCILLLLSITTTTINQYNVNVPTYERALAPFHVHAVFVIPGTMRVMLHQPDIIRLLCQPRQ